ncbi:hypothetical protein [Candidatus Protochlamydia sp. R18]|uniref:hypothetical protein n=1 Tax=Candidatus Protochlamydia sp. R18 TaxID=1353977 RepID=UPI0011DCD056|nr:hypothetical protein [Candidatus Protochlamydia sp. R18]
MKERLRMEFVQQEFEIGDVLCKPLMAHLSTVEKEPSEIPLFCFFGKNPFFGFSGLLKTVL